MLARRTVLSLVLGAVGALALVAGCGGSGGSREEATTENERLGKPEFLARANASCRQARVGLGEEVDKYLRIHRSDEKPRPVLYADLAHFVLLPVVEQQINAMYRLGLPSPGEEKYETLLGDERQVVDRIATTERVGSIAAVWRQFAQTARTFRAYGLPACANGPEARRG